MAAHTTHHGIFLGCHMCRSDKSQSDNEIQLGGIWLVRICPCLVDRNTLCNQEGSCSQPLHNGLISITTNRQTQTVDETQRDQRPWIERSLTAGKNSRFIHSAFLLHAANIAARLGARERTEREKRDID